MKSDVGTIAATPSKRLYLSIIADYNVPRSICELIDNGLDVWVRSGRKNKLSISITLDRNQQTIEVEDNAGGLKKEELTHIVAPGHSGTKGTEETIGIFGVGTKRAVVALAQDIKIFTRYKKQKTHLIEFDDDWIRNDDDWNLPFYEVDDISEGTTIVKLHRLRQNLSLDLIASIKRHLSATYARFLKEKQLSLSVDGEAIKPLYFDNWSYPPGYEPHIYNGKYDVGDQQEMQLEIHAGLISESSPAAGEYGVYVYCNGRLVARALKSSEVGFMKGYAGLPHPKVSLTRVLVFLSGSANKMPWNSSKSGINPQHGSFKTIQPFLMKIVTDYAKLSKTWMGDWPDKVFKHTEGEVISKSIPDVLKANKSYLPPLPKSRPRYAERIKNKNKSVSNKKPWTKGLYEGVVASDSLVKNKQLTQANRIALVVLDSTLEIAMKEYLVHESGTYYNDKKLLDIFSTRHKVITELIKYISIDSTILGKMKYYNDIRNKLIHQTADVSITNDQINGYKKVVEKLLRQMFDLKFER